MMDAAGEQCDAVATEAELTHEIAERKLLKEEQNIVTDVEWGLSG
jgi:hypothetical protein